MADIRTCPLTAQTQRPGFVQWVEEDEAAAPRMDIWRERERKRVGMVGVPGIVGMVQTRTILAEASAGRLNWDPVMPLFQPDLQI